MMQMNKLLKEGGNESLLVLSKDNFNQDFNHENMTSPKKSENNFWYSEPRGSLGFGIFKIDP